MVELLAATALSTLLFISALAVIRTLGLRHTTTSQSSPAWTLAARQQLEWDLTNAVVFRQDDHGLVLGGYGSLDTQTLAPTHLAVMITYAIHTINSQQILVREQTSLDPIATDLNFSELVCSDVKSFSITGSYVARTISTDAVAEDDPTPVAFQQISQASRVPDRFRLRIDLQNESDPIVNTILYLH